VKSLKEKRGFGGRIRVLHTSERCQWEQDHNRNREDLSTRVNGTRFIRRYGLRTKLEGVVRRVTTYTKKIRGLPDSQVVHLEQRIWHSKKLNIRAVM
jgi:hypothetical protein